LTFGKNIHHTSSPQLKEGGKMRLLGEIRGGWFLLGGNMGNFGDEKMMDIGLFGSGIGHVVSPSQASARLGTNLGIHVIFSAMTGIKLFCPTAMLLCMGAPYVGISMPSPARDLGERLSLSVP
jgi:hypothetical protein